MADDLSLVHGTLDLIVLNTLRWGAKHGYDVGRWIREQSRDALLVEDRALYLSLHRLEERGWIESTWGISDNNRRARFYRLTQQGRRQFQVQSDEWQRYAKTITAMLRMQV
jgi:transcriptional regulator